MDSKSSGLFKQMVLLVNNDMFVCREPINSRLSPVPSDHPDSVVDVVGTTIYSTPLSAALSVELYINIVTNNISLTV